MRFLADVKGLLMSHHHSPCYVLVPAAGVGQRALEAGQTIPKQYQCIGNTPVLVHTLKALISHPIVTRVILILSPNDTWFDHTCPEKLGQDMAKIDVVRCGGVKRADSVRNGLEWLKKQVQLSAGSWVMVHDAARPFIQHHMIDRLWDAVKDHPIGGLLALQTSDTVKLAVNQSALDSTPHPHVQETLPRHRIWLAQTPQIFRAHILSDALESVKNQTNITDESTAVEAMGLQPILVQGDIQNIKITWPDDLRHARQSFSANCLNAPNEFCHDHDTSFIQHH
jgi:2-C-methyl-D-erythritol 4-phosphate cytidylyltransferase